MRSNTIPEGQNRTVSKYVEFAGVIPIPQNELDDWSAPTTSGSPRLRLDNDRGVVPEYAFEGENVSPKRKRALSKIRSPSNLKPGGRRKVSGKASGVERQKITRACDACKTRKSRCSGTLPCHRCNQLSIPCRYDSLHKRGQPPSPPRQESTPPDARATSICGQPKQLLPVVLPSEVLTVQAFDSRQPERIPDALHSSRSSPGRDATNVEGQYIGPTSGLAFLHRAKGRLRQDFSSSTRNINDTPGAASSIFTFGDKAYPDYSGSKLVLPSRIQAREHVKRYFEFSIPTYRFLHQGTIEDWLEKFMNEAETAGKGVKRVGDGKASVVLMVLATSMLYRVDDTAVYHDTEAEDYDRR